MSQIRYKVDIYARGVVSTTGTVSYTIATSHITSPPPVFGGYTARPLDGRVEGQPWAFRVVDVGSTFTGKLADSSGRQQLLGRLVRARQSVDSTASTSYKSKAVGRLSDVILGENPATYTVMVADERTLERNTKIFTKLDDSVSLMPGGLVKNAPPDLITLPGGRAEWNVEGVRGNIILLSLSDRRGQNQLGQGVAETLAQDIKKGVVFPVVSSSALTAGLWTNARWRNVATSANYEIAGFGSELTAAGFASFPHNPVERIDRMITSSGSRPQVWVVWTVGPPAKNTKVYGYVHMSGAAPSPDVPRFIGGEKGLHPGVLARSIYQNTYSDSTAATIRYSTGAFNTWIADPTYGKVWFRIAEPMMMADFMEPLLYQAYGMMPTIDSSGKIAPRSVLLPSSQLINVGALLTVGSSNTATHPTWSNQGREVVNALTLNSLQIRVPPPGEPGWWRQHVPAVLLPPLRTPAVAAADHLMATTITRRYSHDNVATLGRRERTLTYGAISLPSLQVSSAVDFGGYPETLMSRLARNTFDRFGDGPVYSDLDCLSSVDASTLGVVKVGDYVKVVLATFPNGAVRGGTRYMQVMSRSDPVGRPQLTALDVGPAGNPLATPTITLALSSFSSRHAVKATVGSLAAGAGYELRMASLSTGTTATPATASSFWQIAGIGTSTGLTQHVYRLASRRRWFAEVRASKPLRIQSAWSTAKSVVTASIPAPSAVSATVTGRRAVLRWTNGSSLYPTCVYLHNTSAAFVSGSSNQVDKLPGGTTRTDLIDLTAGATHRANLWHADPYGGFGINGSVVFAVASTNVTAPAMKGLSIVQGVH